MDMHIIGYLIFLIVAAAIVFWLLSKVPLPEPFNWIVYGVIALIALYILGSLLGVFGGGGLHLSSLLNIGRSGGLV